MTSRSTGSATNPRRAARRSGTTAAMIQLGCDKNTVDGERILGELDAGGFEIVGVHDASAWKLGLLVVNTCSFIGPAREESIRAIEEATDLKSDGRVRRVAVAGCFSKLLEDRMPEELRSRVDFFIGPGDIDRTVAIVTGEEEAHFRPPARSLDAGPRLLTNASGTAFVKIAEGCDKTCSFCTIPSIRGGFVSRRPELVVDEISALTQCGVKEIVLVSQDTASYGGDIGTTLADLVRRIDEHDAAFRLRIHYLYPSQVTDDLIESVAESRHSVAYWDIPIQHASPTVLKAMRRPPNPDALERLVDRIRARFDESAIRTTVIAGHPGETLAEFKKLLRFIERIEFDRLGVFPFSPEPGTAAAAMKRPRGADERAREVMELQSVISARRLARRVGREYEVLMDSSTEGRSAYEAPDVDGVVRFADSERLAPGQLVRARITGSDAHDLWCHSSTLPHSAKNSIR